MIKGRQESTMLQLSSLRLLLSHSLASNSLSRFSFPSSRLPRPRPPFGPRSALTILAYAGRRPRRGGGSGGGGGILQQRRGRSTQREEDMEGAEGMGFNKRRAEGRDKSGKTKNLQLKTRKLNPVNTICYVQILGTGMDTQDTSPSVLLFFDKQRFIFNAGEGLQRFCTEHKIKLSKIDHMFLTRVCSETAGGLPGLLLTLAGIGEEGMSVNIWGPSDLNYLVDAMSSFIPHAAMIHTHSFGATQNGNGAKYANCEVADFTDPIVLIDDEVVKISAIPLRPQYDRGLEDATANSYSSKLASLDREDNESHLSKPLGPSAVSLHGKIGSTMKPGDVSVIYACELPEIKGKFDPNKAVDLGLKPGPKYRELQLGNSVMSDHQDIMVHPSDVLGPSSPGPIVLIVDCPTQFHIPELFSVQSLNCYYKDSLDHSNKSVKSVNCIIHLGPASVTKHVDYQNWMKKFGSTQHIMAGHEIKNMEIPILKSSARIASRLNYLCPQLFPAPGFWSLQHINNFCVDPKGSCEDTPTFCENISAENLLKFHLRPYAQLGLDRSVIPSMLSPSEIVNELLSEIPEIVDVSKHISQFWQISVEGKHTNLLKDKHVIVEEPWISESSCSPNVDSGKQGPDAFKDYISSTTGCQKHEVRQNLDIPTCLENVTREDMEIILLGTGSSQPSKYRNVSSIFINLFSKGRLLLDCGEGTLAQLRRRFGLKGADEAVRSLKCIWISHIHADHHTGLARILALRCQLLKGIPHEPLLVIGPRPLKRFLDAYSRLEDLDMQFLDCRYTTEAALDSILCSGDLGGDCLPVYGNKKDNKEVEIETMTPQNLENTLFTQGTRMQSYWKRPGSPVDTATVLPVLMRLKEVLHEAGLEALYSVPVVHCPQAFGVVLKAAERINGVGKAIPGWKLVYSGDTRPCQALIDASNNATVLIHEATFEESMGDEAIARNHSTTMEAIKVGGAAGVYRVILTHFSQRYPKIPVFDESHMHNTSIAFDLMSINIADLPVLPKVLPYLKVLFRNEMVVDESDEVLEAAVYR